MSGAERLRLVGDVTSTTAMARAARGLAGALHRQGVALDIVPGLRQARRTDEAAIAAVLALQRTVVPEATVLLDLPDAASPDASRAALQLWNPLFAWDIELARGGWREADLLVAPSAASGAALRRAGFPGERIRLMPLGVDPAVWQAPAPNERLLDLRVGDRPVGSFASRFISVSQPSDGSFAGQARLLEAWIAATSPGDDAVLMLCWEGEGGMPRSGPAIDALALEAFRAAGKQVFDAAPIGVVPALPRDKDLPGLFAAMTHFIALDRGTAWNLAMLEAGAAGLRLIAPDHSSYRDWLHPGIAAMLPAQAEQVEATGGPAGPGIIVDTVWSVDPAAAVPAIREAVDRRDRSRPPARETILRDFTWDRSAEQFRAIAGEAIALRSTRSAPGLRRGAGEPAAAAAGPQPTVAFASLLAYLEVSVVDPAGRLALLDPLFASRIPVALFADRFYRDRIDPAKIPPWVSVLPFDLAETAAWRMISAAGVPALPRERNPVKDTLEFMALQLAKTEVVRRAVDEGLIVSPLTGFIDAGIAKVFEDPAAAFRRLAAADLAGLDRVLVPGKWPPRPVAVHDLAEAVDWAFCGGMFILPRGLAAEFDRLALAGLAEFLARGRLAWEVNVWALVASRRPEFFQWYQSDHNDRFTALPDLEGLRLGAAVPGAPWPGSGGLLG
ncbi:MAG: hypothetical protein ACKOWF_06130 [Chloroflexota bacterium]